MSVDSSASSTAGTMRLKRLIKPPAKPVVLDSQFLNCENEVKILVCVLTFYDWCGILKIEIKEGFMKKLISSLLILVFCFSFSGCTTPKPKTYVHGDWEVIYNEDGTCTIYDFSEEGKQKEVLVFPEEVAGREVIGTYYVHSGYYTNGHWMKSEKLERLYFTKYIELNCFAITSSEWFKIFLMYEIYDELNAKYMLIDQVYGAEYVYFDFPYLEIKHYSARYCPANVTYYYNYATSPNYGVYMIDDYDGELIEFIPENPTREGYEFVGWYKEPECIIKWNFETDIIKEKKYVDLPFDFEEIEFIPPEYNILDYYEPYETKLYAGWREKK
ncbi:MAG: hypothetical protein E7382_06115 [Clostridiales bacterium]|nr:hypothetical protein [Clostridiales bacterium]